MSQGGRGPISPSRPLLFDVDNGLVFILMESVMHTIV